MILINKQKHDTLMLFFYDIKLAIFILIINKKYESRPWRDNCEQIKHYVSKFIKARSQTVCTTKLLQIIFLILMIFADCSLYKHA